MAAKDKPRKGWVLRTVICVNSVILGVLAVGLFFYPAIRSYLDLKDPALRGPGVPGVAWRLYRNLTPKYAAWAKERVSTGVAEGLSKQNISGTEWPLFGSVFHLWGLENLQKAWEAGDRREPEPKVYARDAIVAASELVIDPKHASWVKKHWGEGYLHRENVFYRLLVIAALTSRANLLHDNAHIDMLRDQVETFATELDDSKSGLLDDYPAECYPGDVMAAVMCIKRADGVLGTDHSKFIARALRGFTGTAATPYQVPPYSANSENGLPNSTPRGCGNSYMLLTSPELWPAQAKTWYALHERYFWQRSITAFGFREFPKDPPPAERVSAGKERRVGATEPFQRMQWGMDVDAGPIIAGHGVAASAFGLGAARKNGRFDHAYPLAAEMLVTTWELPTGTLAVPRLLSNASDAPYLGEAAILWLLSIQPEKGFAVKAGGGVPTYFYVVASAMLLIGSWLLLQAAWKFYQARKGFLPEVRAAGFQIGLWVCFVAGSVVMFVVGHAVVGMALLLGALMLPVVKRQKKSKDEEEWPTVTPEVVVGEESKLGVK